MQDTVKYDYLNAIVRFVNVLWALPYGPALSAATARACATSVSATIANAVVGSFYVRTKISFVLNWFHTTKITECTVCDEQLWISFRLNTLYKFF